MTITSKYDVNQELWYLYKDKVRHSEVLIITWDSVSGFIYEMKQGDLGWNVKKYENELYSSKQELLNVL